MYSGNGELLESIEVSSFETTIMDKFSHRLTIIFIFHDDHFFKQTKVQTKVKENFN